MKDISNLYSAQNESTPYLDSKFNYKFIQIFIEKLNLEKTRTMIKDINRIKFEKFKAISRSPVYPSGHNNLVSRFENANENFSDTLSYLRIGNKSPGIISDRSTSPPVFGSSNNSVVKFE